MLIEDPHKKHAANSITATVTATAPPIRMSSSVAGSFTGCAYLDALALAHTPLRDATPAAIARHPQRRPFRLTPSAASSHASFTMKQLRMMVRTQSAIRSGKKQLISAKNVALHFRESDTPQQAKSMTYLT